MKLYRFVSDSELKTLKSRKPIMARTKIGEYGSMRLRAVNSAINTHRKGIFFYKKSDYSVDFPDNFSMKKTLGENKFFCFLANFEKHWLLELEVEDKDSRIIETCKGFYYGPVDEEYTLDEVILSEYGYIDIICITDMNKFKMTYPITTLPV